MTAKCMWLKIKYAITQKLMLHSHQIKALTRLKAV